MQQKRSHWQDAAFVTLSLIAVSSLPRLSKAEVVEDASGQIFATRGGKVILGSDLTLTYKLPAKLTSQPWERCYWFWVPDTLARQKRFCSFELKEGSTVAEKRKCVNMAVSSGPLRIDYAGTSEKDCAIVVRNVTKDVAGTWMVRVDDEWDPTSLEVKVIEQVDKGWIRVSNLALRNQQRLLTE